MKLKYQADVALSVSTNSNPSPHYPRGWPLGWVMQVITFPEEKMLVLRGPDATLYVRFLRGCCPSIFHFILVSLVTHVPELPLNRVVHALAHLHYISDPIPHSRHLLSRGTLNLHDQGFDFPSNGYPEGQVSPLDTPHRPLLGLDHLDDHARMGCYWTYADASG